ncbi:MAG: hypothetical protein A3I61_16420 [Acidobacteria bacterium RIFCSPLOWO2_02_FULL_68_18]|nr:MAG: hypothetical protein A3I61_16420 [Acidobacteria bacterium RIFCSPLOWO2_02_FULL_68_18]OFW48592.1 MAG: hypothetical protein A3G77_13860 [Acidobacteria bacterium RIFCSPLOWO2_12_FULL_68_19]
MREVESVATVASTSLRIALEQTYADNVRLSDISMKIATCLLRTVLCPFRTHSGTRVDVPQGGRAAGLFVDDRRDL